MLISFKEFLSQISPEGGGEIWDNRSNIDVAFGEKGIRSKNVQNTPPHQNGTVGFDPDKKFLGVSKKMPHKKQEFPCIKKGLVYTGKYPYPTTAPGYGDNYGFHI